MGIIGDFLIDQDYFGHHLQFNFDKQGDNHRTKFGGFISIIVKFVLSVYIFLRFRVLIEGDDDEVITTDYLLGDEERSEDFIFKDIAFMLTPGIRSVRDGKKVIDYDDKEVRKYIELTFV